MEKSVMEHLILPSVPSRICGIFQRLQKPQNPMRTKSMHRLSLPRKKIEAALAHVNYKNIEIKGNQVRLKDPQAKIDLGGIAKGFIADEMRSFLNKRNHLRRDQPWGKCPDSWEKGRSLFLYHWYPKPFSETGTSLGTLNVSDASVVSSGIYERYYRVNGKLYHHILDTSTGYPVENHLYQVTIISDISMDGDALSTTCFSSD